MRCPDVQVEAVFAPSDRRKPVCRRLRTCCAEMRRAARPIPFGHRLRWFPAEITNRRSGIGHAKERNVSLCRAEVCTFERAASYRNRRSWRVRLRGQTGFASNNASQQTCQKPMQLRTHTIPPLRLTNEFQLRPTKITALSMVVARGSETCQSSFPLPRPRTLPPQGDRQSPPDQPAQACRRCGSIA